MHCLAEIKKYWKEQGETYLLARLPGTDITDIHDVITQKDVLQAEIRLDDGRHISAVQRRKIYATIRDIANETGYLPEEAKEHMKYIHMMRTGEAYFSLSVCSMDTAREFINTLLEFVLENGIPLSETGIERADDIDKYLYFCLVHRKCAVCGRKGEIHHVDTIGMGNNRKTLDDSAFRKICLCRNHHTISHAMGNERFYQMYKVYGIVADIGKSMSERL